MKSPKALLALAVLATNASAIVTIDYVTVGNPGNAADTNGFGSVAYEYQIGKYEVTNAQYAEFLNAKAKSDPYGLYNENMANYGISRSGSSGNFTYSVTEGLTNRPVVYVSWFDAARFSNWLHNGQGNGDTETGSYNLNGVSSGLILAVADAKVRLPSEDEWYKAAYYNGANSTYSLYPNGSNTISTTDANYGNSIGFSTDVGSYSLAQSYFGTFDQAGNVWEWIDEAIGESSHVQRGGYWRSGDSNKIGSTFRGNDPSLNEANYAGFRLITIPEPSAMILTILASGVITTRRKR